jgi:hypothetical protein
MTRADLELRLTNHFENSTYYESGDLSASIQDGYDELCAYTGILYGSTTVAFTQDKTYYDLITLIPGLLAVVAIFNSTTRRWLIPVSHAALEVEGSNWNTVFGAPDLFTVLSHRFISIFPKPSITSYGDMVVYYKRSAPAIGSADAFLVEDEHVRVIEQYCISDLQAQAQEWTKSTKEFMAYVQAIEQMRITVQSLSKDRIRGLK